jgi:hypothetical protein
MPFEPGRKSTDSAMHLRVFSNDLHFILTEENGLDAPLSTQRCRSYNPPGPHCGRLVLFANKFLTGINRASETFQKNVR